MQTIRDCSAFRANLDAYLDGELKPSVRQEMDAHLEQCDDCRRELDFRTAVRTACAELDEGLAVPPECHVAWMRAIKRASLTPRRSRSPAVRWAAGIAASLAVWLGVTGVIRSAGLLTEGDAVKNDAYIQEERDSVPMNTDMMDEGGGADAARSGYTLSADGAADDTYAGDIATSQTREQKIIRSASRTIETSNYDSDTASLDDLVAEYNAYFEYRSEDGRPLSDGGNGRTMQATVRVPTASLDSFLKSLVAVGETVSSADNAEDVSDRYYDTETRLATLHAQLTRLVEMNATAQTVEELLAINAQVQEVEYEIEQLESSLADLDSQVSYSTVSIWLVEVEEKDRFATIETTLNQRIAKSFRDSLNWLVGFLQDSLVVLAMIGPQLVIWIPAALVAYLVYRLVRRAVRKH